MTDLAKSNDALEVAYGHNYVFEERVSASRQTGYEQMLTLPSATLKAWRDRHKSYLSERVHVRPGQRPETFGAANAGAHLVGLADEQWLARLENLGLALAQQGPAGSLAQLSEQLQIWREKSGDEAQTARQFLEKFCEDWNGNGRRDHRPSFAAFFDELREDVAASDWPNRVRNRLGLSHYDVRQPGREIPVALMRYRVSEVLGSQAPAGEPAFAVPTVLDGELNSHFFPSPRQAAYGRTLDLEPDEDCERLVAEVLHRRIEYRPEHIFKLGFVTSAIPPFSHGAAFARLRNGHRFCLRYETGRDDFGADIAEVAHG